MDSLKDIWHLIANAGRLVLVFNVLLMVLHYKRLPFAIRTLGLLMLTDMLTEMTLFLLKPGVNNMPLLHGYTILSFMALLLFYKVLFKEWVLFQKYFFGVCFLTTLLLIGNSLLLEPVNTFNSNAQTVVKFVFIGLALTYFFRSFGTVDFTNPANFVLALINSVILIYYSGSLFVFMFAKLMSNPNIKIPYDTQIAFWVFNGALYLFFQLIIFVALWKAMRIRV